MLSVIFILSFGVAGALAGALHAKSASSRAGFLLA